VNSRADSSETCCPVGSCAELVSGKWTLLIIRDLCDGPQHFGDLEKSLVGISPRTLCERLKLLVEYDIVSRTYIKGRPPRTTYELTIKGQELVPLIDQMRLIGERLAQVR
jgi:DNA-binding HxlR family transcriptional regulator